MLHRAGRRRQGRAASGDIVQVVQDKQVGELHVELSEFHSAVGAAVEARVKSLKPYRFDRIHGAFPDRTIWSDGKACWSLGRAVSEDHPRRRRATSCTALHIAALSGTRRALDNSRIAATTLLSNRKRMPEGDKMNIDRRQLALPFCHRTGLVWAASLRGARRMKMRCHERREPFRAAQVATDGKALDALCAPELSYATRCADRGQGDLHQERHRQKNQISCRWPTRTRKIRVVGNAAIVRFNWVSESEAIADGKKSGNKLHILMNWQKQGADSEAVLAQATKL